MRLRRALLLLIPLILALGIWLMLRAPTPVPAEAKADAGPAAELEPQPVRQVAGPKPSASSEDGGARESQVLVRAPWGSGPGQLGRERRTEGNAEGPMSLAVGRAGELLVLDQANGRIARFDASGKWKDSIPVTVQSAQDVVRTRDGKLLLLDRLADSAVSILDENGKPVGQLPLVGDALREGGQVTGLFSVGDQVYAEKEHGTLVLLGDVTGKRAAQQTELPGRPSRNGQFFLSAGIVDANAGRLFVNVIDREPMAQRFTRALTVPPVLTAILLLDTDVSGVIYFAVSNEEGVTLMCLDPRDGRLLGTSALPPNLMPEESFRDFAVQDSGGVVYAYRTEQGVELRRYDCRP